MEVSQGLGAVFDGKLLGYDHSFLDPEANISLEAGELDFVFIDFRS